MTYQRKNPYRTKFQFTLTLAIVLLFWLLLSILADRSPVKTLIDIPSFFRGDKTETDAARLSRLELELQQKNAKIDSLIHGIKPKEELLGDLNATKGMVDIESDKLNLRSAPSLNSKIVLKLPDSSEIDILEYDDKVYYLDGSSGYWCKVRFIDVEGWAWGNYIKAIE